MLSKIKGVFLSSAPSSLRAGDCPEEAVRRYIDQFSEINQAAKVLKGGLRVVGVGLRPVVDHFCFLTLRLEKRALEFKHLHYVLDKHASLKCSDWHARVYRRSGFPSVLLVEPLIPERGKRDWMTGWLEHFGDEYPCLMAVRVDKIENAVFFLEKQGVAFSGKTFGEPNSPLRQTVSLPEAKDGKNFTALELVERHGYFHRFLPDALSGIFDILQTEKNIKGKS